MLRVVIKCYIKFEARLKKNKLKNKANVLLIIKHELIFYAYFCKPYY
jgi:hypothetical protein